MDVSIAVHSVETPVPKPILVQGNMIGVNAGGAPLLPRTPRSIFAERGDGVEIGGTLTGAGNVIAGGEIAGVSNRAGRGARVLGNSILGEDRLAIDLLSRARVERRTSRRCR